MRTLLIRCYPAAWRERYGDEFASILEERPLGPFDVADVLLGALDARLRMRDRRAGVTQRKGFNMSLRIGGIAAILGATILGVAWVLGSGYVVVNDVSAALAGLLLLIGLGLLLVAIAGLTAFQARTYPGLSWAACGVLMVGTIIAFIGFFGAWLGRDEFWNFGALGFLMSLVGTMLFAIATYRTAALSRGAAVLLGIGATLPFVGAALGQVVLMPVAMAIFLVGWFLLGLQAMRLDSPATGPRPA